MQRLISKYLNKLHMQGLANKEKAILLALDAELYSNKPLKGKSFKLNKIFKELNINSILYAEPYEPYRSILNVLTYEDYKEIIISSMTDKCQKPHKLNFNSSEFSSIIPMDCETRTFLHEIPVIKTFSVSSILNALSMRKSAIIQNKGIIAYGAITPEQAYISYSSTCFAVFVKYFLDALIYFEHCLKNKYKPDIKYIKAFKRILKFLHKIYLLNKTQKRIRFKNLTSLFTFEEENLEIPAALSRTPQSEEDVFFTLSQTGKILVAYRLVDSYFGNISYVFDDKIYISQTGSSLDELEGCIDAVPLDGSSSIGITASSELSTHKSIFYQTGDKAILHGHPLFSVIISLYCQNIDCHYFSNRQMCHIGCKEKRYIKDIPIVSGEIGTGNKGIVNTVPLAMGKNRGVIVYGHGVFTSAKDNFYDALSLLIDIERICQREYFNKINNYLDTFNY